MKQQGDGDVSPMKMCGDGNGGRPRGDGVGDMLQPWAVTVKEEGRWISNSRWKWYGDGAGGRWKWEMDQRRWSPLDGSEGTAEEVVWVDVERWRCRPADGKKWGDG